MTTFKEKPPIVDLVSHTPDPLETIYEMWCRSRDIEILPVGRSERREEVVKTFHKLIFEFTQIPEAIQFTWWIDDMPRAFFDQMTRYRKTGFFARSQRIRDQRGFAKRGEYLTTPEIANDSQRRATYDNAMDIIDQAYTTLIEMGCPAEDARGLLPLHMRTGFMWTMSLRDMAQDIFRARTCVILQQDYWAHVASKMRQQMCAIDPEFAVIFKPPCQRPSGGCLSTIEAQARIEAQYSHPRRHDLFPCKYYDEHYYVSIRQPSIKRLVDNGVTRWARTMEEVLEE